MTSYFCWTCKTKDHWANEVCPKKAAAGSVASTASQDIRQSASGRSAPVEPASAAIRKRDLTPGMGVCEFALASKLRDEGRLEELRELLKKYPSDPPLTNPPLKSWYGKPVA